MEEPRQAKKERTEAWDAFQSALEKIKSAYDTHSRIIEQELQSIKEGFDEIEKQKEECMSEYGDMNVDENDLLQINVSGKIISVARGVLTQVKGSMLEAMFSGRWENQLMQHEDGFIFLDVNSTCFQAIVDYLVAVKYSSEKKVTYPTHSNQGMDRILQTMMKYYGINRDAVVNDYTLDSKDQKLAQNVLDGLGCKEINIDGSCFSDVKKAISNEQKSLNIAKKRLQKAKASWEQEKQFIQSIAPTLEDDLIHLNVRGTLMTVKRSTLRIFEDSQLGRQFDGNVWPQQNTKKEVIHDWSYEQVTDWAKSHGDIPDEVANLLEENKVSGSELLALGREDLKELGISRPGTLAVVFKDIKALQRKSQIYPIFIDHSPYCFGKIIDQLRLKVMSKEEYQPLSILHIKKVDRKAFIETVEYYFPGELAQLILRKPICKSNILSEHQVSIIDKWLEEDGCGVDKYLLYRASRDGWKASDFHDKCDNQGPTLTIIKSAGGYIFGGYCNTSWSSVRGFKASLKAFLFTIQCQRALRPTKMKLKPSKVYDAVFHGSEYGPCFGDDLEVSCMSCNNLESYTNVGNSYVCPSGEDGQTFLTGGYRFQAKEIEIFSVQ
uniref:TLDc domain-containing protein n=1 Tax=Ditylum brightwellii TaxID=49249 RepID=A0A6U3TM16_9STRA|mmetsp:Transcript_37560/g.56189  ORF Transcript_37560/g.56189 Transcript_37560/m.56189 type:complete len:607 (+) Transcript_37560:277-2097(+)